MTWQPINTAPKNGSLMIGWGVFPGEWGYTPDVTGPAFMRWNGAFWAPTQGGGRYDRGFIPSLWIPFEAPECKNVPERNDSLTASQNPRNPI